MSPGDMPTPVRISIARPDREMWGTYVNLREGVPFLVLGIFPEEKGPDAHLNIVIMGHSIQCGFAVWWTGPHLLGELRDDLAA